MYTIIFITCAHKKEARRIARALVENKVAACVNIIDHVESIFRWQGKLDRAGEVLLVVKSKKALFLKIVKLVKSLHSYSLPEVIAFGITQGEKKYLNWINESC